MLRDDESSCTGYRWQAFLKREKRDKLAVCLSAIRSFFFLFLLVEERLPYQKLSTLITSAYPVQHRYDGKRRYMIYVFVYSAAKEI